MKSTLGTILLMPLICIVAGCAKSGSTLTDSKVPEAFPEMLMKARLQQEAAIQYPLLKVLRSTGRISRSEFVLPTSIGYSNVGDLFISDNNGQTIQHWGVNDDEAHVFLSKSAVGLLEFPNSIQYVNDQIFVADNAGIKVFSVAGKFERVIRTYFTVFSFVVTPQNTILINPIIRKADAQDPLIVELDSQGKRIRGFGLRHNTSSNMFEDRGFLTLSETKLFVGFKYRRSIEVYDINSGNLIDTISIDHAVLNQLPDLRLKNLASTVHEAIAQPRYIAGVKSVHDRLFVCLHLPQPEILEFDNNGRIRAHFRVPVKSLGIDIFGFEARDDGQHVRIAIGLLEPNWSSTIYEVTAL